MSVTYTGDGKQAAWVPVDTVAKTSTTDSGAHIQHVTSSTDTPLYTSVDSSVLPTGAATAANQTNGQQQTKVTDGSGVAQVVSSTDDDTSLEGVNGLVAHSLTYARHSSSDSKPIRMDKATHSLQVMDYEHHEIHAGSHFFVSGFESTTDGQNIDFVVETPNTTKWAHMTFQISGTGQTEIYVYEGANSDTDGTAATPINNDRNSSNTSALSVVKNPTVNSAGTLIFSDSQGKAGATPARSSAAGVADRNREIILKQNDKTMFRITSREDGNIVSYIGEWYEHTNKG